MKFVCLLLPNFRSPSHEPAPFLLIHIMAAAAAGKVEILSSSSLSLTIVSSRALVPLPNSQSKLPLMDPSPLQNKWSKATSRHVSARPLIQAAFTAIVLLCCSLS